MKTMLFSLVFLFALSTIAQTKYSVKRNGVECIIFKTTDTTYTNKLENGIEEIALKKTAAIDTLLYEGSVPDSVVLEMYLSGKDSLQFSTIRQVHYLPFWLLTKKIISTYRLIAVKKYIRSSGSVFKVIKVEKYIEKPQEELSTARVLFALSVIFLTIATILMWRHKKRKTYSEKTPVVFFYCSTFFMVTSPFFIDAGNNIPLIGTAFLAIFFGFMSCLPLLDYFLHIMGDKSSMIISILIVSFFIFVYSANGEYNSIDILLIISGSIIAISTLTHLTSLLFEKILKKEGREKEIPASN